MRSSLAFLVSGCCLWASTSLPAQDTSFGTPALLSAPDGGLNFGPPPVYQAAGAQQAPVNPASLTPGRPYAPGVAVPGYPAPAGSPAYVPAGASGVVGGSRFQEALENPCVADCAVCRPTWYGSVAGLVMSRDNPNRTWVSFQTSNPSNQILNTPEAEVGWQGGFEVRVGRQIGCDHALEGSYWMIVPMHGEASVRSESNDISTPIDVGFVTFSGTAASDYFDNAREHRVTRRDEIHNIELSLLHEPLIGDATHDFSMSWMLGARFFRFDEDVTFGSVAGDHEFGEPLYEAYMDSDIANNLIGFQLGARADYHFGRAFKLFAAPKVGIYGNYIDSRFEVYRGDGVNGHGTPLGGTPFDFPVESNKTDVAMLAQLDLGLEIAISRGWAFFGGYRAVAVSGLALADSQFPMFLVDGPGIADIESNGHMILHGAFAGLQYSF
jgi:hypothetical protein